ncbi:MAG: glycine/sarcosine/betaine reductase selenoprotein B family protein [Candidatus Rokuibacteriota bacterium]
MAGPRAAVGWMPDFRARFDAWWPAARPLLEAHAFAQAFATYPWVAFDDVPWTAVTRPLAAMRIALVTTAGLYRHGVDAPFMAEAPDGDAGYRALPRPAPLASLKVSHVHFNREGAEADINTVYPIERLAEMERAGEIGSVAPTHYSIMGYAPRAADLAAQTAPAIARAMRAEGVDAALLVPV